MTLLKIMCLILSLQPAHSLVDLAFRWKAKVIYPDNEIKEYIITKDNQTVPIVGLKWKCHIITDSKTGKGVTLSKGTISCTKGDDILEVPTVCIKSPKYTSPSEESVIIIRQKKQKYVISNSCSLI